MPARGGLTIGVLGTGSDIDALIAAAPRRGDRVVLKADPADGGVLDRLLDADVCDVVAVGTGGWPPDPDGEARRIEAVRLLVQAGRSLLLAHPLSMSMLWAYELDMIRQDSGAVLIPWLPARLHPLVARLRQEIEAGVAGASAHGALETVRLERLLPDRSRERVLAALARDVDLVRCLVGEPTKLGTLGGSDTAAAWGTLAVGFTGPDLVPVRWQVSPGAPIGLKITLQYAAGSLSVEAPDDGPWTWNGPPTDAVICDAGDTMLAVVHAALDTDAAVPATQPGGPPAAGWADAARAIELAETVPRSLAKGRSVDLHREEFSELGTFRGTMASLGCGLVLAALLLLLLATLVGGIAREFGWEFGKRVAAAWPFVILAALVAFLALQILPLLIGGGPSRGQTGTDPDGSSGKTG